MGPREIYPCLLRVKYRYPNPTLSIISSKIMKHLDQVNKNEKGFKVTFIPEK